MSGAPDKAVFTTCIQLVTALYDSCEEGLWRRTTVEECAGARDIARAHILEKGTTTAMSSFRFTAPRRFRARYALAMTAAVTAVAAVAPSAQAAFTTNAAPCSGSSIQGAGATFQTLAQAGWTSGFQGASPGCANPSLGINYIGGGSGAGRTALGAGTINGVVGARDAVTRYAGSDNGPSPTQRSAMEGGPTVSTSDDTQLLVMPAAVGAVTVVVNFPEGCRAPTGLQAAAGTSNVKRFKLPKAKLEAAFNGDTDMDTWGELVPGIEKASDPVGTPDATTACADKKLIRVVRFDNSGTTYVFKYWMNEINSARVLTGAGVDTSWSASAKASNNALWPNATSRHSGVNQCTSNPATNICDAGLAGNDKLLTLLAGTDGAIGYADLADARAFSYNTSTSDAADDLFWVPVDNGAGAVEPSLGGNTGVTSNSGQGSDCAAASFTGTQPDASGDWSSAHSQPGAGSVYGGCGMTFELAFKDNAPAWGTCAIEQARARTVKDYISYLVSDAGQNTLPSRDYSKLPTGVGSLQAISIAAAASITFDAANAGSGGCPGSGGTTPPATTGGGGGGPTATVSNAFTIGSASAKKGKGTVALTLQLPGAGKIAISGKSGKKAVGKLTASSSAAGPVKLTFKLNSAGKKLLKKKKKLKVSLSVTFTPTGGTAKTSTKTVTLKK